MKAEILKIAGVKSEKEFYKKYPSEEAFMKVHGKEFKKAKLGKAIAPKAQDGIGSYTGGETTYNPQPINFQNAYDAYDLQMTGSTDAQRLKQAQAAQQAQQAAQKPAAGGGGGGMDVSKIMGMIGGGEGGMDASALAGIAKQGKKVPKYQNSGLGLNSPAGGTMTGMQAAQTNPYMYGTLPPLDAPTQTPMLNPNQNPPVLDPMYAGTLQQQIAGSGNLPKKDPMDAIAKYSGLAGKVYGGIKKLKAEKEARKSAEQQASVSELSLKAALSKPEQQKRTYRRPEDALIQPDQLFPSYGVGTNVLTARDGSTVKAQFGCKGESCSQTGYGMDMGTGDQQKSGAGYFDWRSFNTPVGWDDLLTYNSADLKGKDLKQYNKDIAARTKSLQTQFPGVTEEQVRVAGGDSTRIRQRMGDLPRYDQASEQTFDKAYHQFYRPLMDQKTPVTVEQILNYQTQQPGGLGAFKTTVQGNYGRKKAQDGMQIGGNQTEIQNMYNPGDIYQDLGFEPLSDSEIVKQYREGGLVRRMQTGGGMPPLDFGNSGSGIPAPSWETVGNAGQMIGQGVTGNNAGGELGADIGGTAGGAIGMAVGGPAGKAIGQAIGQTVGAIGGGLLDSNPRKMEKAQNRTKRNVQTAAAYSMGQGLQSQYSAYVRNGGDIPYAEDGWVSNDWLPQTITQFGEHKVSDLLRPDPIMNTLRTGGHISQNKMYPQDQYALGGELKTTWGGYTEPISRNPFEASETGIFRGKSHEESDGNGHTGIGVKYGEGDHDSYTDYAEFGSRNADADVEVERGEPYKKDAKGNMLVAGNLVASKEVAIDAGKKDFGGMKYKNIIKKLAEQDKTYTKNIDKASSKLAEHSDLTPFGILEQQTLAKIIEGNLMKLKENKVSSDIFFVHQDATNETAKEYGVDADALAKGKIKVDKQAQKEMAKYGKEIFKAQTGVTTPTTVDRDKYEEIKRLYKLAQSAGDGSQEVEEFQKKYHEYFPEFAKEVILNEGKVTAKGKAAGYKNIKQLKAAGDKAILSTNVDKYFGPRTEQYLAKLEKAAPPRHKMTVIPASPVTDPEPPPTPPIMVPPIKEDPWMTAVNQLAPYLRPSDVDYNVDLYPEMMAAGMNQVEPVFAQGYQPQLLTPYDISYQDQLNEITAQARAAERMAGQNPAAGSALLATASGEKNKVLGEQFRQNQAQRMGVYNQNINTLNDAQLKNIGIYADQAMKQSQARSNTKAQAMEIIKSMSDKIAKNKLENKTLQIYENLYNYRFGKDGRAQNYNPLAQFDVSADGKVSAQAAPEGYEYETILKKKKKKDEDARNGSIVRALKNF
jgi:hypothetical protein